MKDWKLYCDKLDTGLKIEDSNRAHLNRFKAMFDLAKNFQKVDLTNTLQQTIEGYSAIFAVFLAFNAAEKLGSIKGFVEINKWELLDQKLSTDLRLMLGDLYEVAEEFLDKSYAREQLVNFINGENDNIRIPATAIRNGFAHGSLTPHILNATTIKNHKTLFELSEKLLDESERLFSNWVNSI